MRLWKLIKGDIEFQVRYGFYFVYAVFTIFYILLLFSLPEVAREKAATLLIYTDPAAMGLFFMGAIVLLEKSQRVLNSIAVSPVKASEYIISKVLSLGIIATLVGVIIALITGIGNITGVAVGTFLGSIVFSLFGLMVAAKISSLNQFMIATVPFELLCFIPPVALIFGYQNSLMLLHPGCIVIQIFEGSEVELYSLIILFGWIGIIYWFTYYIVKKMFQSVGGVKL